MSNWRRLLAAWSLLLVGCSSLQHGGCAPGEQAAVSEFLYFGTDMPGGLVSSEEWTKFLSATVTPRFPAGLTVWRASGQWQSSDGNTAREGSYVLSLIHPADAQAETAVQAIVAEYKTRFHQDAVLRVKAHACMSL
jgi:Protein of unknown function (DUF3574)